MPLPSHGARRTLHAGGLKSMAATNSGEDKIVRPEIERIQPTSPEGAPGGKVG